MNLESLMSSNFYIINLNESTKTKWCYHKAKLTSDFKIKEKDLFKTYCVPEYLNGVIVGFYYWGPIADIPKRIEELKIYQQISKAD